MAENNANQLSNIDIVGDLPLGQEDHKKFGAIANQGNILELARILKSLGDLDVEIGQTIRNEEAEKNERQLRRRVSVKEYFSTSLKKVIETVDLVFEWLEQTAKKARDDKDKKRDRTDGKNEVDGQPQQHSSEYQKKESVLRGLYHITALGSHTCSVGLLELASKFLDLPENPYNAKREHVKLCLEEVEVQKQKLFELVEKACNILQEITRETEFNHTKAIEFDSTVREANALIESCKSSLLSAEETIDELMKIMSTMKVFSRVLRVAGFGATCYGLYHMAPSSATVDKLADSVSPTALSLVRKVALSPVKHVGFAGLCAFFGYAWLSFFPSRAYAFRDDLTELKLKHKRLTNGLQLLERRLDIVVNEMGQKTKMWSNKEDSV